MTEYNVRVNLSGDVMVAVEADSPEEARKQAEQHAEIGDVSSWTPRASLPLPTTEDGDINCSAEFGEMFAVRITYNTDPQGNWVADDDYSNVTLHGTFDSEEAADEWLMAYPDGDKDVKDMDIITINRVRPA